VESLKNSAKGGKCEGWIADRSAKARASFASWFPAFAGMTFVFGSPPRMRGSKSDDGGLL